MSPFNRRAFAERLLEAWPSVREITIGSGPNDFWRICAPPRDGYVVVMTDAQAYQLSEWIDHGMVLLPLGGKG